MSQNNTMTALLPLVPQVGDLASYGHGGDSYPYTVINVSPSGKTVTLQARSYKCTHNNSFAVAEKSALTWENPEGEILVVRQRRDGRYYAKGSYARQPSVHFGTATYAQDPHF
jgi:hypothetical protein